MAVRHCLQTFSNAVAAGAAGAHHIQGCIRVMCKDGRIGQQPDGRCIDQDDIRSFIQPVQQCAELSAPQKGNGPVDPAAAQKHHVGIRYRRQAGNRIQLRVLQKFAQAAGLPFNSEKLAQLLGAQVRVNQHHTQSGTAHA